MSYPVQAEPGVQIPGTVSFQLADSTPTDIEKAVEKAVASRWAPSAWGRKKRAEDNYFELELPSGQVCLLQKLDPMVLIENNLIDEIDFFSRKLFPEKIDNQGNPVERSEEDTSFLKILSSPEKRARFFNLLDSLLTIACIEPKVVKNLPEGGELPQGTVWVGNIDLDDKMQIFIVLNDPQEAINKFRREQNVGMANVESGENLSQVTQ